MASSNFICSHQIYSSCNGITHFNSFKKASFSIPSSYKFKHAPFFERGFQFSRIRATASDSKTGRKEVEVVYDIEDKFHQLADEVDKNTGCMILRTSLIKKNTGNSRLSVLCSSSCHHIERISIIANRVVYDLEDKFNKLADEVDKNSGMSRLTLFSPCKINVFLRITGKREDGYHDLASLFHVISLGDKIKFSLSPSKSSDRLSTNVPGVPLDDRNLIIKALNLFRKKTGTDNYFWIHLDKKVPTGAGLGGGNSNAATALWAANQFSGCVATEKELQEWSGEIGSDIPFFFSHGAAYCTGRGEIVEDIPKPLPFDVPLVLIKPQEACSTAEVYKLLTLDQTSKVDPLTLLEKISRSGISQDVCINDLEPPAFEVLPSLKRLKKRLIAAGRGQYDAVFMSGSGSTIVGVGSPDPPQFIYDDDEYKDVFLSEASFITRAENQWYTEVSMDAASSPMEFSESIE